MEHKAHACWCTCASARHVFSVWHAAPRTCQSVYFWSLLSLRVLMCVFSSALFGLSVTAVKHIPIWTAGWVHTLSISPPLRVHVLTCVKARLCVSMCGWVVDPLFIATAFLSLSPIPHVSSYLSEQNENTLSSSPPCSIQRLILCNYQSISAFQIVSRSVFGLNGLVTI